MGPTGLTALASPASIVTAAGDDGLQGAEEAAETGFLEAGNLLLKERRGGRRVAVADREPQHPDIHAITGVKCPARWPMTGS